MLSAEARAALEGCGGDEAAAGATSQIGTHLKRKVYLGPHRTEDKRTRTDAEQSEAALAITTAEGTRTSIEKIPTNDAIELN